MSHLSQPLTWFWISWQLPCLMHSHVKVVIHAKGVLHAKGVFHIKGVFHVKGVFHAKSAFHVKGVLSVYCMVLCPEHLMLFDRCIATASLLQFSISSLLLNIKANYSKFVIFSISSLLMWCLVDVVLSMSQCFFCYSCEKVSSADVFLVSTLTELHLIVSTFCFFLNSNVQATILLSRLCLLLDGTNLFTLSPLLESGSKLSACLCCRIRFPHVFNESKVIIFDISQHIFSVDVEHAWEENATLSYSSVHLKSFWCFTS